MPKISVIVPVYKAEAYLPQCIDSILSQTEGDFELFLVNDGSPDGCGAICDAYAAKDSRIRVIHQENQGQAAARNHALEKASGEWVCFVDSDDLIHPQHIALLLRSAEEAEAGISMCAMVEAPELPDGFMDSCEGSYKVLAMDEGTMVALHDAGEYPAWVACGKLIRRELVESYRFRPGRIYEDNEAVCRWVCAAGKLVRIDRPLYYYRTNPVSTTQNRFSKKKLDYLWALESIIRHYSGLGWQRMRERFVARYIEAAANFCYEVRLSCPEALDGLKRSVRKYIREEGLRLSPEQRDTLLQAMYPRWMKLYWPAVGAVRTVRRDGVSGVCRKILGRFGKGETS